jgi:flavin reductase (DIM6/NTAB) family NADH-FMN oxidoreductase RutF
MAPVRALPRVEQTFDGDDTGDGLVRKAMSSNAAVASVRRRTFAPGPQRVSSSAQTAGAAKPMLQARVRVRTKVIMQIDPSLQSMADNYKVLTNIVVPRPIAWITTLNGEGVVNLAPFSFFNAVCADPLYVAVSIGRRDNEMPKDTALNIETSGEFVVNLVTEELLAAMNITAGEYPPDRSELAATGLYATASTRVAPPRVALAQASLECRLFKSLPLGVNTLFVGEVLMFHVADHLLGPRLHIEHFEPIGRLGSPSVYCRTIDRFELPRFTYEPTQRQS